MTLVPGWTVNVVVFDGFGFLGGSGICFVFEPKLVKPKSQKQRHLKQTLGSRVDLKFA